MIADDNIDGDPILSYYDRFDINRHGQYFETIVFNVLYKTTLNNEDFALELLVWPLA